MTTDHGPATLERVLELDHQINEVQDLDVLLELILSAARELADADAGSLYLVEPGGLRIRYAQNDTLQAKLPVGRKLVYALATVPLDSHSVAGHVAVTGRAINLHDVYRLPPTVPFRNDPSYDTRTGYRTVSMLAVPLRATTGEVLGVLQIINARGAAGAPHPFSAKAERLVTHFANGAAVALQRARLVRALLLRMISMAELRDPTETGPHVNRVAAYTVELYDAWAARHGEPAAAARKNRDILRMAAMLHDVGKVAISDLILKKPGGFTPDEYMVMKQHTVLGARLFATRESEFDAMAQDIALTHHERWDGKGYPGWVEIATGEPTRTDAAGGALGRRGEEIPLWGRLTSVADIYDALRSRRVYKEAWTEERVVAEIRNSAGAALDPELVDIFNAVLPQLQQAAQRIGDEPAAAPLGGRSG